MARSQEAIHPRVGQTRADEQVSVTYFHSHELYLQIIAFSASRKCLRPFSQQQTSKCLITSSEIQQVEKFFFAYFVFKYETATAFLGLKWSTNGILGRGRYHKKRSLAFLLVSNHYHHKLLTPAEPSPLLRRTSCDLFINSI